MAQQRSGTAGGPTTDGMPMLGLGTWQNDDPDQCAETVETALDAGYRHVDTAQAYGNEEAVGQGIERADVDREDVFLATKVWKDQLAYDDMIASTEDSLGRLDTDYVDLLYVHWPAGAYDPEETMAAFDELLDQSRIRNVGVSNFEPHHVEEAADHLHADVFANQVECHPLLPQDELREHAEEFGYELVAYSPLARGEVFDVPAIRDVAEKHDVSPAQVSLAWLREKGVAAIPKSTSREHVLDNWRSLDLELDDEDVAAIDDVDRRSRRVDPSFAPAAWD